MPARKRSEVASSEEGDQTATLARRLVSDLRKDSDIADYVKLASDELGSDVKGYVSTQVATLDHIFGRPGVPLGRLSVFIGKEGGGKSTLVYHILAEVQRQGGLAVLIDAERRMDKERAARIGIDLSELVTPEPRSIEKAFKLIEETVEKARKIDNTVPIVIAIDSLTGLPTEKQLEGEIGGGRVAGVSGFVSSAFPRLLPEMAKARVGLVIVNQLRAFIDTSGPYSRGEGRRKVMGEHRSMIAEAPLIYWGSLIVYLTSTGILGEKDNPTGIGVKATVRKNTIAPGEGKDTTFDISFLNGIDVDGNKLDLLESIGVVKQSGGWYALEGVDKKFRKSDWPEVLAEHPELEEVIRKAPVQWLQG